MIEGELTVIGRARELQRAAGIDAVPVSIEKYLRIVDAELEVRFDLADDEAGQCLQLGSRRLIWVNGKHSPERQRFTALHELAHLYLGLRSAHGESVSVDALLRYARKPREEILCDVFAAECLFPHQLFVPAARGLPCTMESIARLAEEYQASLTATGSRFAAYSTEPCAWVLADEGRVRYHSCSPALRERGFWIPPGIEVPKLSVLGGALAGARDGKPDTIASHVWTSSACRGIEEFFEEVVLVPSLSQGLALLSAEDAVPLASSGHADASEEDELLPELDGQLRFGKRTRRK